MDMYDKYDEMNSLRKRLSENTQNIQRLRERMWDNWLCPFCNTAQGKVKTDELVHRYCPACSMADYRILTGGWR